MHRYMFSVAPTSRLFRGSNLAELINLRRRSDPLTNKAHDWPSTTILVFKRDLCLHKASTNVKHILCVEHNVPNGSLALPIISESGHRIETYQ